MKPYDTNMNECRFREQMMHFSGTNDTTPNGNQITAGKHNHAQTGERRQTTERHTHISNSNKTRKHTRPSDRAHDWAIVGA